MKMAFSQQQCKVAKLGLKIDDTISFPEWEKLGEKLKMIEGSVQFWIGDWLNFGKHKWGSKYEKALENLNYEYQTLRDNAWVANKIELSRRKDKLSFTHHKEVANLSPSEQDEWLDKAEKENLSVRELREEIRKDKYKQLKTPELPEGEYNVILADPPWRYDFSPDSKDEVENKYPTMELEEIKQLEIPSAEDAVLFLWATAPKLEEALEVLNAWGFTYRTNAVWDKEWIGMGYWFRGQHELLLVGVKGKFSAPEEKVRFSSVIREKRTGHSEKPKAVYEMIEKMLPNGKYLELFARGKRTGWEVWGNEIE